MFEKILMLVVIFTDRMEAGGWNRRFVAHFSLSNASVPDVFVDEREDLASTGFLSLNLSQRNEKRCIKTQK